MRTSRCVFQDTSLHLRNNATNRKVLGPIAKNIQKRELTPYERGKIAAATELGLSNIELERLICTKNSLFERLIHYATKEDPYLEAAGQKRIHLMMNELAASEFRIQFYCVTES